MKKTSIIPLALGTIVGFPSLAFVIHYFLFDTNFLFLFVSRTNLILELSIGSISGVGFGYLGWLIISMPFMKSVLNKYKNLINTFELDTSLIFFVSFCAGFGEEILFRGVLQPHLGVWLTAIIFVAIHGYLNPKNWKISVYGIYLTVVIGIVGYLSQYFGLITAIISHMMIDVILFYKLKETN